jgi:translation initiation factor IF-1
MAKKDSTDKIDGVVTEALPNTMFRVELNDGRKILATLKGILRRRYVRIFPGDRVKVEMNKYDEERGRIVFKYRK